MKKICLLLPVIVLSIQTAFGQLMPAQDIRLPSFLATSKKAYEFSSMARWGDRILMVPAMKAADVTETFAPPEMYSIYYMTAKEATKAIADEEYEVQVDSIEVDMVSFDFFVKSKYDYDGIEGTAIVGDLFFFVVETKKDNDKCYIARAHIENSSRGRSKLVFDKTRPIRKSVTGRDGDQGFESLAVLPDSTLMAVYEFSETKGTLFHKLSVDLGIIETGFLPVLKATKKSDKYPKYNRLSEMTSDGKVLVGINSIFKDVNNSYSELVSFSLKDGKFVAIGSLCLDDCADNWEGLLRFNGGWLLLSDNKFDETVETRLSFFRDQKVAAEPAPTPQPSGDAQPLRKKKQ